MPKTLSIEYAHIYTNKSIGDEQKLSVDILEQVTKDYAREDISLVVMVDDYSFPDPSFNYELLVDWLTEKNFKPDLILRESQLIPICDQVLALIPDSPLYPEILNYVKAKKYPCSLFVAAWYLARLGYVKNPIFNENLVSSRLINILPLSFKPFEDKAFDIIRSTPFAEAVDKIDNKYFEGRMI